MKQLIHCGCENWVEFERQKGETKRIICNKCRAAFISNDEGYYYKPYGL